jgi:hypothetical protein
MNDLDPHYPPETCPFCTIGSVFPCLPSSPSLSSEIDLAKWIPTDEQADPTKTTPPSFVILASEHVLAFLDILPMTRGHVLVSTRAHRVKVADLRVEESREVGELNLIV